MQRWVRANARAGLNVRTRSPLSVRQAALCAAEALEKRCLLSAGISNHTASQAAVLAAVPSQMQGQFVGSRLELSPVANAHAATPDYVLLDPSPSLTAADALAPYSSSSAYGLTPAQVRHAYGIDAIKFGTVAGDGTGQTIAIIDAYDDPTAVADLHAFDQHFGLSDPPSFTKVNQSGGSTLPGTDPAGAGNDDWELEESLDIEWTHAIAPQANIILVEANSADDSDLIGGAVAWARSAPGVTAVSMSFGEPEYSGAASFDSLFTTPAGHGGVTFLASTGDTASPSGYPAYSPNVVAVGGTTLNVDSAGNYLSETGWSDGGGGISDFETQPTYQQGIVTQSSTNRANPDVSFDADPSTGVAVYDSYDYGSAAPWIQVGGTSLSAPSWAGLIAIADQGRVLNGASSLDGATQTLPRLYSATASNFNDITSGNNGFSAGPGYDLVTGRGTPIAQALIPRLSAAGPYVSTFTPGGLQSTAPSSIDFTFSTPMDPTSFSVAADVDAFTGPGNADLRSSISGFSWLNNDTTLEVDFVQPTVLGPYTMTIGPNILSATGSAMDQNQNGVNGEAADAFTGTFYYDVTPTQVLSTNPPAGGNVAPPFTTLDLYLSAALDPASVGTGNLTLNQGTVSAATLVDPTTVQYTLSGILRSGTITITMAQGALKDTNENPVLAFSASYVIPTPPTPGAPMLLAATDSGVSNSDGITNFDNSTPARAPQFSVPGTVAGDIVSIYADGILIGSATASSQTTVVTGDGKTAIPAGAHQFTARQGLYGGQGLDSAATRLTIIATPPSLPVAGAYDPTFNLTGTVADPNIPGDGVYSEAIQPDGKILAGGDVYTPDGQSMAPIIGRYSADGQLDPTFGANGHVTLSSTSVFSTPVRSIVLQADGKIVFLVIPRDGSITPEVVRLNSDGTFDASFGANGVVQFNPDGSSNATAAALLVQPDGKLIVAGSLLNEGMLARYDSNGTLDSTFGGGAGYVLNGFGADSTGFAAAALESNGDIVVGGEAGTGKGYYNVLAARFLSSGAPDGSFNGVGYAETPVGSGDSYSQGVAIQPDGRILVTAEPLGEVALVRFNANGSLDSGFGSGGIVELNEDMISSPVVESSGRIVVGGTQAATASDGYFTEIGFIDRLNADGSLDKTFHGTGQLLTPIGSSGVWTDFNAVVVQPDGNLIAGGQSPSPDQQTDVWTLVRVDGTNASLALDPASDSGISNSDQITNVTSPTFDITSPSTLYVRVYRDGTLVSSAYATGSTVTLGTQPAGTHQYTMTVVDAAGNESAATAPYSVTIDTTPPTVQFAAVASGPNPVNSLTITFSKPVYGLTLANLQLTRNGVAVPLTNSQTLTTSDNKTWTLGNLASLTGTPGAYQLILAATPDVTDLAGNALTAGASATWSLGSSLTATSVALIPLDSNPSNATQTLTFTAAVSGGVPNGETVTLEDASSNNTVVASGTLSNGSATLTIPAGTLAAETHSLIAVYGGDAKFAASQSAPFVQTVLADPTITGITPSFGPLTGGTTVIINGTGFTGATAVDFGTTPASSFTINSTGTQITALDPAGSGTVDVTVVGSSGGISATSSVDQFTYAASAVSVTSVVVNGNNPALAGVQRSMVDSIVYTFNQAVTLAATNAFSIALNASYAAGTLPTLTWAAIDPNADGSSTQWAVTFSGAGVLNGSIADGVYNITLSGSAVTAVGNSALTGTSQTDMFYRLFGDATGVGSVSGTDYNALLSTFNLKTTATGYLAYFNEDGASKIDAPNYNAFLTNFGKRFKNVTSITTI